MIELGVKHLRVAGTSADEMNCDMLSQETFLKSFTFD